MLTVGPATCEQAVVWFPWVIASRKTAIGDLVPMSKVCSFPLREHEELGSTPSIPVSIVCGVSVDK